jgi:uncharacterized protein YlaI
MNNPQYTIDGKMMVHFHCDQCHEYVSMEVDRWNTGVPATTGHATNAKNEKICYGCATKNDRESMAKAHADNKPVYQYVDSECHNVVNWPGFKVGAIFGFNESRAGWNGSTIARFLVKDTNGKWWKGRGAGRGMCCTLRPCAKRPASIDHIAPKFPSVGALTTEIFRNWKSLRRVFGKDSWGGDGADMIDCRLQCATSGWSFHIGSSDYDTSHAGFWGASCMSRERQNCRELARNLIDEARDAYAESES